MRTPSHLRTVALFAGALVALSACDSKPTTINQVDPDDMKTAVANAAPVELPPSILASKTFRCKDNSVVSIDFYSDNKSASLHPKENASPIMVKAPDAGKPMVADGGYAVSGDAKAASVDVTLPGKDKQTCDGE